MQCLKFSQQDGFAPVPNPLVQSDGFWADIIAASGYSREEGANAEYGDQFTARVTVYRKGQYDEFLVEFEDYAGGKVIFVSGEADLFALHLRLSSLFLPQVEALLREMNQTVNRAFKAWHGHDSALPCRQCDPDAWAAQQRRQQELAKTKG